MPDELTLCNTSPLLYLNLVEQLDLLPRLYGTVAVPPAVKTELQVGGKRGIKTPDLERLAWIDVVPVPSPELLPLIVDLGRGEAEVIALGLAYPGSRLILDDALARRIARLNGLKFTGTLGVVVRAKQVGLLDRVRPIVGDLRQARPGAEKSLAPAAGRELAHRPLGANRFQSVHREFSSE